MMIEPWFGSFLIGFFGVMIIILILNKTIEWGCLGIIILILGFLFWGYIFDYYPTRSIPSDMSPSQSVTGRMGWFLGAASSCIWLDAPKKEKLNALISVSNWGRYIVVTAIYFIGVIEAILIFSSGSFFTAFLIGTYPFDDKKKGNGARYFGIGLVLFLATIWIWWHWETSGYAAALYEIDTAKSMFVMLATTSLFYGRTDTAANSTVKKLESILDKNLQEKSNA